MAVARAIFCLLFVIYWLQEGVNSTQTDGTLMSGNSGINVVVAVLEKLYASQIFRGSAWFRDEGKKSLMKEFLRYKAFVDSEFGNQEQGRIWNVTQQQFDKTISHVMNNNDLHNSISTSTVLSRSRIDWLRMDYSDTSVPLYSGLAIMLYLDARLSNEPGNWPSEVRDKSTLKILWMRYFDGEELKWLEGVDRLDDQTEVGCTITSDVVFVIDTSHSIQQEELNKAKNMVRTFTEALSASGNRIGIILIRTTASVYLPLSDGFTSVNKTETLQRIDEIPYVSRHTTNIADGLCKLSNQAWREDDVGVLKVAIILTDGLSTFHDSECDRNTTEAAKFIRENHPHMVVLTVGIGDEINTDELTEIASTANHVTTLKQYEDLDLMEGSFRYQICYTLSAGIDENSVEPGMLRVHQIARWTLNGVGDDGATIRICVTNAGSLTLYVSYLPIPSETSHDIQATVATTNEFSGNCETLFVSGSNNRKRRQVPQDSTTTIYIAVVGEEDNTMFSITTRSGNVTIDVNECQEEEYPCHESAVCYNTDGSFYCHVKCQEGFGDGFQCTGVYKINQVAIIVPSVVLSAILLLLITVIVLVFRKCRSRKLTTAKVSRTIPKIYISEIQFVRENLKRVNKTASATNPLSVNNSPQELDIK